jgi:hypothetical protein
MFLSIHKSIQVWNHGKGKNEGSGVYAYNYIGCDICLTSITGWPSELMGHDELMMLVVTEHSAGVLGGDTRL